VDIVLDANAIIRDYWLRGRAARRLLEQAEGEEIDLYVPDVVIAEVLKHFRADLQGAVALREKADDAGRRVMREHPASAPFDIDAEVTVYEAHLRDSLRAAKIVSPTISHADLAARAVARHKPFKKNGAGYQDTLVWELVRERAREGEVALISNNSTDFGGDETGGLDEYLLTELAREDLVDNVERFPSITAFNAIHLAHAGVHEAELAGRLDGDQGYADAVAADIAELVARDGPEEIGGIGSLADSSTITVADVTVDEVSLLGVNEIGDGDFYASFEARGEVVLDFPMLQYEGWEAYSEGELEDWVVGDLDEHFGQATMRTRFELTADATYDPETGELRDWEISWARRVP
jgi:predicted nucleic acid-binding protein